MNSFKYILFVLVSALLVLSCQKRIEEEQFKESTVEMNLSSVFVPESRLPLFANISDYNLLDNKPDTKVVEKIFALDELLDKKRAKTIELKQQVFTQIPFLNNDNCFLASIQEESNPDISQATAVKKYYIEMTCPSGTYQYVVTLITSARYADGHRCFDFLNRPNYTGAILYSKLDGRLFLARTYLEGKIMGAKLLFKSDAISNNELDVQYINLFKNVHRTKSDEEDGGWIDESICIGHRSGGVDTTDWNYDDWQDDYIDTDDTTTDNDGGDGGGGGNGDGNNWSWPPECEYTVSLSCNVPDMVGMDGSGSYTSGTIAFIGYHLTHFVYDCAFQYWTGAFQEEKSAVFLYPVTQDVVSTAYFDDNPPCRDSTKNLMNPLKEMRIAATQSGSYLNGTFKAFRGYNEDGSPRYHWGVDFYALVGTPIYSVYTGIIRTIEDNHKDEYEMGSYGNIVVIEYEFPDYDKSVFLQYSHLNYGNPVAINPRTGEPFKVGDTVYQGDLFAYTGKTGNAWKDKDVPNKHLDLSAGYTLNWRGMIPKKQQIDPMPFINGTINMVELNLHQKDYAYSFINNQKCD